MRSSTSNSERRVPVARWGAIWLVVVAVALGGVVGMELFVRARGYAPSVKDDEYAWAWERMRVVAGDTSRKVAFVGSSRMLLAYSPAAFRAAAPGYEPVVLAINGTQGIATLRDLAADSRFRGVAVVEVTEYAFVPGSQDMQAQYIAAYHERWRTPGAMLERRLATFVQSRLALVSAAGVRALDALWRTGAWPAPNYVRTFADRSRHADYSLADARRLARLRERLDPTAAEPVTRERVDEWVGWALSAEPAVAAIQARGGRVVYLRMITCDARWASDERIFPKAAFWDAFARQTRATTIHFRDHAGLADFACPDSSHIDSKDAARFTRALVEVLRAKQLL